MITDYGMALQGVKMLYISGSADDNTFISNRLSDAGILCECTSDSREALAKIETNKYDIIFIDSILPHEDGITMLCQIHNTHLCDEIPIVIVTENHSGIARQSYLSAGFTEHLEKPLTPEKVGNIIIHCLKLNLNFTDLPKENHHILVIDDDNFNLYLPKKFWKSSFR